MLIFCFTFLLNNYVLWGTIRCAKLYAFCMNVFVFENFICIFRCFCWSCNQVFSALLYIYFYLSIFFIQIFFLLSHLFSSAQPRLDLLLNFCTSNFCIWFYLSSMSAFLFLSVLFLLCSFRLPCLYIYKESISRENSSSCCKTKLKNICFL